MKQKDKVKDKVKDKMIVKEQLGSNRNKPVKAKKSTKKKTSWSKEEREYRRKRARRTFLAVLGGLLVLGAFIAFAVISTTSNSEGSVFKQLDALKTGEIPYLVAVSEDFSQAGSDSRGELDDIFKAAKGRIKILDIRYDQKKPSREALYFIDTYGIETLPALVLVGEDGSIEKLYALPLDKAQILDDIDRVVTAYESGKTDAKN